MVILVTFNPRPGISKLETKTREQGQFLTILTSNVKFWLLFIRMNVVRYQSDQKTIFRDGKISIWGGTSQIFRTYQKSGLLTEYFQNINIENIKNISIDLILCWTESHQKIFGSPICSCTTGWLTFTVQQVDSLSLSIHSTFSF